MESISVYWNGCSEILTETWNKHCIKYHYIRESEVTRTCIRYSWKYGPLSLAVVFCYRSIILISPGITSMEPGQVSGEVIAHHIVTTTNQSIHRSCRFGQNKAKHSKACAYLWIYTQWCRILGYNRCQSWIPQLNWHASLVWCHLRLDINAWGGTATFRDALSIYDWCLVEN